MIHKSILLQRQVGHHYDLIKSLTKKNITNIIKHINNHCVGAQTSLTSINNM